MGFILVCSKEINLANHKFPLKKSKRRKVKNSKACNAEPSRKLICRSSDGPVSLQAKSKAIRLGSENLQQPLCPWFLAKLYSRSCCSAPSVLQSHTFVAPWGNTGRRSSLSGNWCRRTAPPELPVSQLTRYSQQEFRSFDIQHQWHVWSANLASTVDPQHFIWNLLFYRDFSWLLKAFISPKTNFLHSYVHKHHLSSHISTEVRAGVNSTWRAPGTRNFWSPLQQWQW